MLKKILLIFLAIPFISYGAIQNIPFDTSYHVSGNLVLDPDRIPTSVSSTAYGISPSRIYNNYTLPIKIQQIWLCYKGKVVPLSTANSSPCTSFFAYRNWIPSGGFIEITDISGYFANDTGNRCTGLPTNAPYISVVGISYKNIPISLTTPPYCYSVDSATGASTVFASSTLISKNYSPAFASVQMAFKGSQIDLSNFVFSNVGYLFGGAFLVPVVFFISKFFRKKIR